MAAVVVFWGFQAGNWRESEWNRMRGFPWCRGTREEGNWGSVPSSPRRRRGGGRADGRGGVARGGEIQHEGRRAAWSLGATRGCHGEQEVACGPPRQRAAPLSAGGSTSRGAGR